MENGINLSEIIEKIRELKIKKSKTLTWISLPTTNEIKTIKTVLYWEDGTSIVKTNINIDGTLEIFIENDV
ncbi:MAG: hypothetical protein ACLQG5_00585 [Methanobacterium sp.]